MKQRIPLLTVLALCALFSTPISHYSAARTLKPYECSTVAPNWNAVKSHIGKYAVFNTDLNKFHRNKDGNILVCTNQNDAENRANSEAARTGGPFGGAPNLGVRQIGNNDGSLL